MNIDDLKNKTVTKEDIAAVLSSIGEPGEKQDEKIATIKELGLKNFQGVPLEDTLDVYEEW
jgi:hypothetical protein